MIKSDYSKVQIEFIMNLKKRGKTYPEIAEEFAKKFGIKKTAAALEATFRRNKSDYNLKGLNTHVEIKAKVMEERMLDAFVSLVLKRKYVPNQTEFSSSTGYTLEQVKRYYDSFSALEKLARDKFPKVFKNIIDETKF